MSATRDLLAALLAAALFGCATPAPGAEDTHLVFAAALCAYEEARAGATATQALRLDEELRRIRAMLRAAGAPPRSCSDASVEPLARCISAWFEDDALLARWADGPECSTGRAPEYW